MFRLQAQGCFGQEAPKLMSERLEDIAKRKSALTSYLTDVERRAEKRIDAAESANYIKERFVNFGRRF